jgi:hypothetical protein
VASETELLGRGLAVVDGDLVLVANGLATVEGRACVHQNLGHRLQSNVGSLFWEPAAGLPLDKFIEAEMDSLSLRRLALAAVEQCEADHRVEPGRVAGVARQAPGDTVELLLDVAPIGNFDPLALVVPLALGAL